MYDNCSRGNETNVLPKGVVTADKRKEYSFLAWLRQDDSHKNIFCILGKPGAGKSTLMRFIALHGKLRTALEPWVSGRQLIIAKYFFWNHGEWIQRSLEGLLRSLLLQILEHHRSLISVAFPRQSWLIGGAKFRFSTDSLLQALDRILDSADHKKLKLFFIIDGLDDFNDLEDNVNQTTQEVVIRDFLKRFHDRPCLKLCISTRPYLSFTKEYGKPGGQCLALHDLTVDDIKSYVRETLGKNDDFTKMAVKDGGYENLVNEIVETAAGVFLWVRLACQSLLSGMTNQDHISDLQHRLRELPDDLRNLYEHLLRTVPQQYQQRSARSLLLASTSFQ
ncbi:hypothetical protein BKA63DRAFT_414460, partial [Paraphoma chrysanthemicola]